MNKKNNIVMFLRSKTKEFFSLFFKNLYFDLLASAFVIGKIAANLVMGASWGNALRSGLTGCILYVLGCYLIHILSTSITPDSKTEIPVADTVSADTDSLANTNDGMICNENSSQEQYTQPCKYTKPIKGAKKIFIWLIILQTILTLTIMHSHNIINFYLPVWSQINEAWSGLVKSLVDNFSYIKATGLIGWPYLILYVLIPFVLIRKSDISTPDFFGLKTSKAALPFVILYAIAFAFIKGISVTNILTLMFVIIWPALGEEFFYRGIVQETLIKSVRNPITGIVLTSFLFSASHMPAYFLVYYNSPVLAFSSLLPVLFTSFFWGYGYYRTKVLWPWILIHAFSNIVGL